GRRARLCAGLSAARRSGGSVDRQGHACGLMAASEGCWLWLERRHKKRRPRTSFSACLVGRGNLKRLLILLKSITKVRFDSFLEYLLEYRAAGFELRMPWRCLWLISWSLPVERYSCIGEV